MLFYILRNSSALHACRNTQGNPLVFELLLDHTKSISAHWMASKQALNELARFPFLLINSVLAGTHFQPLWGKTARIKQQQYQQQMRKITQITPNVPP